MAHDITSLQRARVGHLGTRVRHLGTRVGHLGTRVRHLGTRVRHLGTRVGHLGTRVRHFLFHFFAVFLLLTPLGSLKVFIKCKTEYKPA